MTPDIFLTDESTGGTVLADVVDTYQLLGQRDMERDFRLRTPWLVNASIGYTVGTNLAFGALAEAGLSLAFWFGGGLCLTGLLLFFLWYRPRNRG